MRRRFTTDALIVSAFIFACWVAFGVSLGTAIAVVSHGCGR